MRMILEQPGGRLVRVSPHDHEGAHLIAHVLDATSGDLLRLAKRPAHNGNRCVVLFEPGFPSRHALLFLSAPFGFGKRHPRLHPRTGLAANKDGKVGIVGAHTISFPLRTAGRNKGSTYGAGDRDIAGRSCRRPTPARASMSASILNSSV